MWEDKETKGFTKQWYLVIDYQSPLPLSLHIVEKQPPIALGEAVMRVNIQVTAQVPVSTESTEVRLDVDCEVVSPFGPKREREWDDE